MYVSVLTNYVYMSRGFFFVMAFDPNLDGFLSI